MLIKILCSLLLGVVLCPSITAAISVPIFQPAGYNHSLPHVPLEEEILQSLIELKAKYSRMLWSYKDSEFPQFVEDLFDLKNAAYVVGTSVVSSVTCTACKGGVELLQHLIQTGKTQEEMENTFIQLCISLNIQSARVCEGAITAYGSEILYILKRTTFGSDEVCSFVIGDLCEDVHDPNDEWEVTFPPIPKPLVRAVEAPQPGAPTFKVLHISDTHYDPHYVAGSNADCSEPLCCRESSGPVKTTGGGAGRWGDYRSCDTPKRTLDHMLTHIADTHEIDYIIWTGDMPPHDIWDQTKEENLQNLQETVKQISDMFPGIPIFPAVGNHETAPVNSFPPSYISPNESSISWLYDELGRQWSQWLPAGASQTVRQGAFYSVLVRPGFRIISLNMNFCNNLNWWLLLNSTDPGSELQWFINELQLAELNTEKVHIIGHIPPGYFECLKVWSRNYNAIIHRYEATVAAQFFGHTHFDEFEVFYDPKDLGRATSIAYVGPSVTPYYDLNPGYRIYYVDGDHDETTRLIVDHETWILNLKEANLYNNPIWYMLYSARAAYKMPSLRPQDWNQFITEMAQNEYLFNLYYKHYWKDSPVRPLCNMECRKGILCDARSGRSHYRQALCDTLKARIESTGRHLWGARLYNGLTISEKPPRARRRFKYNTRTE